METYKIRRERSFNYVTVQAIAIKAAKRLLIFLFPQVLFL